jgi:hypothetical protein
VAGLDGSAHGVWSNLKGEQRASHALAECAPRNAMSGIADSLVRKK